MCKTPILCRIAVLLLGLLISAAPSKAQDSQSRSFSIRDGQVHIDGELIAPDDLPPSLEIEGIQVQYTFSGDVRPVIEINGDFFVIESAGLRLADRSEHDRSTLTLIQRAAPGVHRRNGIGYVTGGDAVDFSSFAAPHMAGVGRQARELAAQAMRFQELQSRLDHEFEDQELQELTHAAARLSQQAEQAALAAEALPRLEIQSYLAGVQKHDRELFELLVREREIEHETIGLSQEIRLMDKGAQRDARIEELRQKLDDAFELKQANRRREISQLEDRLDDLQQKLEDRERMRAEIIDNRLRELLDLENEFKW